MNTTSRVTLPAFSYAGYVFDLDGTLVDSMPLHFKAWRMALAANGAPSEVFHVHEFVNYGGRAALEIVHALNAEYGLSMDAVKVANEKRETYLRLLSSETLPGIEEVIAFVSQLKEKGLPFSIGTGSARPGALATLKSAGLEGLFSIIVCPEDVAPMRGKPQPDIFLLCAERMGVAPEACIVFEDAQPGIDAAIAAGMDYALVEAQDLDSWEG